MAFGIALGHAIILGVPVALFYRAKQWKRLSATVLGAAIIGAIPVGILAWPLHPGSKSSASAGGVATIINGIPTMAGWLDYLKLLGMFGGFGALSGLVCWLVLRWSGALAVTGPALVSPGRRRIGISLAAAAVAASALVFALPSITMDRSCHNPFRDGRRSVSTKANLDLDIAASDRSKFAQLVEQFGISHGLAFRNSSERRPEVQILSLSACTEQGVLISVLEMYWASAGYTKLNGHNGIAIGIYDPSEGTAWRALARDLVQVLDAEWHGKVRFRDGSGRFIPTPPELLPSQ